MVNGWPNPPDSDSVTDALKKGHGRAYLWAQAGCISTEELVQACLTDYRFDRQVEDPRGDWLWNVIVAASKGQQVKEAVLDGISAIEKSDASRQLCQLARHFATNGDKRFRAQLERIVADKPDVHDPILGEKELVRLEGAAGFLLAVARHGAELDARNWEWFDAALVDHGVEVLGEVDVVNLLQKESVTSGDVSRFRTAWLKEKQRPKNNAYNSYQEKLKKITSDEIISAAESDEQPSISFRGWGRVASDHDLGRVYEGLLQVTDIDPLRRYLTVFAARKWPYFDPYLLSLCEHGNDMVQRRAVTAVANNPHPEVRRFALERLADAEFQEYSIELLVSNYEQGDATTVMNALVLPDDEVHRHWTLMSLRKLIEDNPAADCQRAAELVYEKTPCSSCRHSTVKLLADRGKLSDDIQRECQFDVEPDTRAIAGGPLWNE